MRFTVKEGQVLRERVDAVLVGIYEDAGEMSPLAAEVNRLLGGAVDKLLSRKSFTGKLEQTEVLEARETSAAGYFILCGLGKVENTGLEQIRKAMGRAVLRAREMGLKKIGVSTNSFICETEHIGAEDAATAMSEAANLALYRFTKYKVKENGNSKNIEEIRFVDEGKETVADVKTGVEKGRIISDSVNLARDLINHPANDMTPTILAESAKKMAKEARVKYTALSRPQIEKLGMGAFLGVSQGSQEPPRFIILEYNGGKKGEKPIVVVGKSITFDSGGISIKPSEGMGKMKYDMSGGAATIGVLRAASMLRLPLNVVGLLPATENMPSGSAIRPGDILRSMSGRTIEIISTDAEGRLVLSDALFYATRYKPRWIIDIATLTGACGVALGSHAIGMLGNDKDLKDRTKTAGEKVWERVWEMPLWDDYAEQIKSPVADMKNSGGREGGVITAAIFLSKFVEDYPWVHLDIASTEWIDKDRAYVPAGPTAIGVRLILQMLIDAC
ncbi:MAG: leucyl aminopeptidase [Nitrospirae bacterium]|nr:leucyl aminopeptidase [Nitrospirota bacterium]